MQHSADRISAPQDGVLRVQARIVAASSEGKEKTAVAKILVFSNQIGCLLGKGGAIITEMRKFTGAYIRIMPKDHIPKCASENEEVIQVWLDAFFEENNFYSKMFFPFSLAKKKFFFI